MLLVITIFSKYSTVIVVFVVLIVAKLQCGLLWLSVVGVMVVCVMCGGGVLLELAATIKVDVKFHCKKFHH